MTNRSRPSSRRALTKIAGAMALAWWSQPARAEQPAPPNEPSPAAPAIEVARIARAATEERTDWFARPPLTVTAGEGERQWSMTFFGFVEADYIFDSTRSYDDAIGRSLVARTDTYDGRASRTQFSMRNTRLGLMFESPPFGGVRPSAVVEGDFFGNQPSDPPSISENAFYGSPSFRVRHAYLRLHSDYADVVAGQTYDVFGWQNFFSPCTVQFLGLPNQLFSRSMQLRISRAFRASDAISVEVAASAVRPAQRDSGLPDGNAGLRFNIDGWKGITTPGNVGTLAVPMSIGVSGTVRRFKVNAFTPPPVQNSNTATGWGFSVDALVPILNAVDAGDRGNRITVTGSFVMGTGIGDLVTAGGGASFPTLPNPAQANPPPLYDPDIDNGLVSFDTRGVLHTIDWRAFKVGLQYYLPPSGRVILAANYTESYSKNMAKLFPKGGAEIELLGRVADRSRYADVNVFWDTTPAVRLGAGFAYTRVEYLDGDHPYNLRVMAQALYVF